MHNGRKGIKRGCEDYTLYRSCNLELIYMSLFSKKRQILKIVFAQQLTRCRFASSKEYLFLNAVFKHLA